MLNQNNSLYQIMSDAATEMKRLGYTENSLKHYWDVWKRYLKYTVVNDIDRTDMDSFLKEKYSYDRGSDVLTTRNQRTAVRALNVLEYFAEYGKIYIRFPLKSPLDTDNPFRKESSTFLSNLKENGYSKATMHTHERVIIRFLHFLKDEGLASIAEFNEKHISDFILEITGHRGKVSYETGSLRKFFRYLYQEGQTAKDYSLFIPACNRLKSREHLPTVWEEDDINRILHSIDTGNPVGKRDFAMILLAVRLGLRGSDIKNLCFSDINWEAETITITQVKTKEPVVLPLIESIGMALVDYLKYSRPISDQPYIFLALRAPYNPLSSENHLHQVLNKYISRSGVIITADKSHGMHSMRHTLASGLLKQGTPLPVISGILGHRDSNTTAEYLRVDIEQLRSCTLGLEVEEHE